MPPLPQRSRHIDIPSQQDEDKVFYAQLRKQLPRETPRPQHTLQGHLPGENPGRAERSVAQDQSMTRSSPPAGPDSVYSELSLQESSKRRSLPLLDNNSDGEHYYRLSVPPPHTPPRLSPKPIRQAAACVPRSDKTDLNSTSTSLDNMSHSAVYHLAGRPGSPHTASSDGTLSLDQHSNSVYAEVPSEAPFNRFSQDNTYELIPGHEDGVQPKPNNNTYEPLEDVRPKALKVSCVFKMLSFSKKGHYYLMMIIIIMIIVIHLLQNDKWKWLFPEIKRKWWRPYFTSYRRKCSLILLHYCVLLIYTLGHPLLNTQHRLTCSYPDVILCIFLLHNVFI